MGKPCISNLCSYRENELHSVQGYGEGQRNGCDNVDKIAYNTFCFCKGCSPIFALNIKQVWAN